MKKREYILIGGGISFITFVVLLSLVLADRFKVRGCGCPKVISHHFMLIFVILSIFFVSSLIYYLFSLNLDKKKQVIQNNIKILYSILNEDEKIIFDLLIKNDGKISQIKISNKIGKLKAHRTIKKLQEKNIVNVKKQGNTNKIMLKEALLGEVKNEKI